MTFSLSSFAESGYRLPVTDRELAVECEVGTFRAGGKGGQHVNKTDSAVRVRHLPSGITVTCQRERSQYLNKKLCLQRLRMKIEGLLEVKKDRVPTVVPGNVVVKRRTDKKLNSARKSSRRPVQIDE